MLSQEDALDLLRKICGHERVNQELDIATRVVVMCGMLPLAIRIVGARLVQRGHWRISLIDRILQDEQRRLGELKVGDLEVRSSFALSYDREGEGVRRLFRLLALVKTADFAAWVAAPLLDCDQPAAEETVDRLVDAQLLEVAGPGVSGETRYRFHDLLRLFARERLSADEPAQHAAEAEQRLIAAYLRLAERSHLRQWPTGLRPEARSAPRWP